MEELKVQKQEVEVTVVEETGSVDQESFDNLIETEVEETTESFDSGEFDKQDYTVEGKEEFVDVEKGVVVDKETLSPWEKIKHLARQLNVDIKDPDTSCKHCNGKGYEAIDKDTQTPIPCECIFKEKNVASAFVANSLAKYNRAARRKQEQLISAQRRAVKNYNQKKRWEKEPTKAMKSAKNRKKMIEKIRKINRTKKK